MKWILMISLIMVGALCLWYFTQNLVMTIVAAITAAVAGAAILVLGGDE